MAPKSIYRQPNAQHFQLVHRSQRDPLINDPEASQHVLKPVQRKNLGTRADLEQFAEEERPNVGEASLYGVYYDDTEYDYMQHLRNVGQDGESMWIEAPSTSTSTSGSKEKKKELVLKNSVIPAEALPSSTELPMSSVIASHEAIPSDIAGLQPNMDPHLRQTLEALEDDAFVDDELADDFFGELVADGERGSDEEVDFEFNEWGDAEQEQEDDDTWQARFDKFRRTQRKRDGDDDAGSGSETPDGRSEAADTIGTLPKLPVIGGKRRKTGTSDASGYSLSSSAVYRNEGLTMLDERFDKLLAKDYDDDVEGEETDEEEEEEAPALLDLSTLVDDFLNNHALLGGGRKLRQVSDMEKLDALRDALGKERLLEAIERQANQVEAPIPLPLDVDEKEDRWDCETILTTYSNLENHPKIIRARRAISTAQRTDGPKFVVDKKTGLPSVLEEGVKKLRFADGGDDSDATSTNDERPVRKTIARSKEETKEEKKARKQVAKKDKQERRKEKKEKQELFKEERKRQVKALPKDVIPTKKL